jgi:hypothetical protein
MSWRKRSLPPLGTVSVIGWNCPELITFIQRAIDFGLSMADSQDTAHRSASFGVQLIIVIGGQGGSFICSAGKYFANSFEHDRGIRLAFQKAFIGTFQQHFVRSFDDRICGKDDYRHRFETGI